MICIYEYHPIIYSITTTPPDRSNSKLLKSDICSAPWRNIRCWVVCMNLRTTLDQDFIFLTTVQLSWSIVSSNSNDPLGDVCVIIYKLR